MDSMRVKDQVNGVKLTKKEVSSIKSILILNVHLQVRTRKKLVKYFKSWKFLLILFCSLVGRWELFHIILLKVEMIWNNYWLITNIYNFTAIILMGR